MNFGNRELMMNRLAKSQETLRSEGIINLKNLQETLLMMQETNVLMIPK